MTPMQKIRKLTETHGFRFTKSLGQNFLTDENILRKMAQAAQTSQRRRRD
jgi:16S rRNA (adenine1518-N6/adenine1519-N6)-dimethyltransferase